MSGREASAVGEVGGGRSDADRWIGSTQTELGENGGCRVHNDKIDRVAAPVAPGVAKESKNFS